MKKFILFLLCMCFFISTYCFAKSKTKTLDMKVERQKLNVVLDGKSYDGMSLYKISENYFFSLKELAAFYQARLEWYSVRKKVSMELKNRFPGKEADDTEETINRVIPEANKDYSESGEEGPGIHLHRFWRRFRYMCGYWQSNGHRIRSRIARTFCPCTLRSEGNAR